MPPKKRIKSRGAYDKTKPVNDPVKAQLANIINTIIAIIKFCVFFDMLNK